MRVWLLLMVMMGGLLACSTQLPKLVDRGGDLALILEGQVKRREAGVELAFAGARIDCPQLGLSTWADAEGFYRFPSVGRVQSTVDLELLVFDAAATVDAPALARQRYALTPSHGGVVNLPIVVGSIGALKGRVDVVGGALGGVLVYADGLPGSEAITHPDGRYLIQPLPEGEVRLRFYRDGYSVFPPEGFSVVVHGDRIMDVAATPVLQPTTEELSQGISGRVLADNGLDLSQARLLAAPSTEGNAQVVDLASDGQFEVLLLHPNQPYQLLLSGDGIRPARMTGVLPMSQGIELFARATGGDLDGDGVLDAVDDDRDGDGCPNEADELPDDPFACNDLDGDGVGDAVDADDDGDGVSDLEEMSMGADGQLGDPNNADDGDRQQQAALGASGGDGLLTIISELAGDPERPAQALPFDNAALLQSLEDHGDRFGSLLLFGPYRADPASLQNARLQALDPGYQGASPPQLVLRPDCVGFSCGEGLDSRDLVGTDMDCVPGSRGRQVCSAEVDLPAPSIVWVWQQAPPAEITEDPELCDGIDNDGDDEVDEGLEGPLCPLQEGVCAGTRQRCGGEIGWLPCNVVDYGETYQQTETSCDCLDNDCNGSVDQDLDGVSLGCALEEMVQGQERECVVSRSSTVPSGTYSFGRLRIEPEIIVGVAADNSAGFPACRGALGGGSLTLVAGEMEILGTVHADAWCQDQMCGSSGGDLRLRADSLSLSGSLTANGCENRGRNYEFHPGGGAAGSIFVEAGETVIEDTGRLLAKGGRADGTFNGCVTPGGGAGRAGGCSMQSGPAAGAGGTGEEDPGGTCCEGFGIGGRENPDRPIKVLGSLDLEGSLASRSGSDACHGIVLLGGHAALTEEQACGDEKIIHHLAVGLQDGNGEPVEEASIEVADLGQHVYGSGRTGSSGWFSSAVQPAMMAGENQTYRLTVTAPGVEGLQATLSYGDPDQRVFIHRVINWQAGPFTADFNLEALP